MSAAHPLILHLLICGWYICFFYQLIKISFGESKNWDPKYHKINELRFRYLTNWNLTMQLLFFLKCLINDAMIILYGPNWLGIGNKFKMVMSAFFASIILPSAIYISISFWILFAINREYLYPRIIDEVIPFWHNHGMHTFILPIALVELFTTKHSFLSPITLVKILYSYLLLYLVVVFETYVETGRWLYPLFSKFSAPISVAILLTMLFFYTISIYVGILIHKLYWGSDKIENKIRNLNDYTPCNV
ncbi:androgen-dependent TFPI-regulating protein-like isoform X3 [Daktulosphaira vitifoliae]|uniref:androgen-dependent TFPI-regulating protein-like isoform X1 n=1 Tax=Daktulosphaira vitifoliae TaxID=58002 RepID=UPI0021A979ED|nr:androgen-dependent TFPI-regulating protein-like isoform X1 [Daktulosphaira vitifoliae]XP_050520472.1 androgen-dependent TFPI-regulating protein-like isoform X2 [Daktulosphaira vitifoliae]XP_050520473.1 androgen-dependent TFPI-regulating protein-like isoform X3 [Daktulosphaira vitifoliae]